MKVSGKSVGSLILFMVVGGLVGTVFGEILGRLIGGGVVRAILTEGVPFGLSPPVRVDLRVLAVTFGFTFKITLLGVVGLVSGVYLYRKL